MTSNRTLAVAIAAAALVIPAAAAQAQPADINAPVVEQPKVRTTDQTAIAARDDSNAVRGPQNLPGPPTWPVNPQPLTPVAAASTSHDDGVDVETIGLGIAGSLLAVGGIAALGQRRRHRPHSRIAV